MSIGTFTMDFKRSVCQQKRGSEQTLCFTVSSTIERQDTGIPTRSELVSLLTTVSG